MSATSNPTTVGTSPGYGPGSWPNHSDLQYLTADEISSYTKHRTLIVSVENIKASFSLDNVRGVYQWTTIMDEFNFRSGTGLGTRCSNWETFRDRVGRSYKLLRELNAANQQRMEARTGQDQS